jgi:hypothetical protein
MLALPSIHPQETTMGLSNKGHDTLEEYGTAVGVAITNSLHDEAIDLAFKRGGGITIRHNASGEPCTTQADLDANAVGGPDAKMSFKHDKDGLQGVAIAADGKDDTVDLKRDAAGNLDSITVNQTKVEFKRGDQLDQILVDKDNDGNVDAVLIPDGKTVDDAKGFRVDLDGDGSIDGYAAFVRNEQNEVTSIRFRRLVEDPNK